MSLDIQNYNHRRNSPIIRDLDENTIVGELIDSIALRNAAGFNPSRMLTKLIIENSGNIQNLSIQAKTKLLNSLIQTGRFTTNDAVNLLEFTPEEIDSLQQ